MQSSKACWAVVHRHGDRHRRPVRPIVVGEGRPAGQARQPAVELDHRAGRPPAGDPLGEGTVDRRAEQPGRDLRVGVGDDRPGTDHLAAVKHDSFARADLGDRDARRQHGAGLGRRFGDGERDAPHPTFDVAPRHRHALQRPLEVHQLDRRRAGVERTGPRADHPLAVQRLLQPRVVDELRRRRRRWTSRTERRRAPGRGRGASRSSSSVGESPIHVSRGRSRSARRIRSKKCSYSNWPLMSASENPFSRMPAAVRSGSSELPVPGPVVERAPDAPARRRTPCTRDGAAPARRSPVDRGGRRRRRTG